MMIIDENFPECQRQLLLSWRISFRQIGIEIDRTGLLDDEIILLLLKQKHHRSSRSQRVTLREAGALERVLNFLEQ